MRSRNRIRLTFIPSPEEISAYTSTNSYYCGLEETRSSIAKLIQDAQNEFFTKKRKTRDPHFASPRFSSIDDRLAQGAAGFSPEAIFDVIVMLATSGMGLGVYRLLNLWIKAKNGRKIHVKLPNGLVVDATQLTHRQFSEFFAEIYAVYQEHEDGKELAKYVKKTKLAEISAESQRKIYRELRKAVDEKGQELLKRKGL